MPAEPTPPMRHALELAWESLCRGSFGIGAVAADPSGGIVLTGRNRINETDPGDDVIANTTLAHAELNVIAKMPYRHHEGAGIELHTTLQPCIQCLGAIRLSSIERVWVLAPDPIWRGIEGIVEHNEFLARNWPSIVQLDVTPWSVLALLLPTFRMRSIASLPDGWSERVPRLSALAEQLAASGEIDAAIRGRVGLDRIAEALIDRLAPCVDEVAAL